MQRRRKVENEELQKALADSNNVNIIRAASNKFSNVLTEDELYSCGIKALWRALQYHRPEFGQKFTTTLYRFVDWECKREIRSSNVGRKPTVPWSDHLLDDTGYRLCRREETRRDDVQHIQECIDLLPEQWQRDVIRQYYIDKRTMEEIGTLNGYSKEAARQKINKAMANLREICVNAA